MNAAKHFASHKHLILFALIIFVFNSCKKELLTAQTEDNIISFQSGVASINPISYADFLKKVNIDKIGRVGKIFSSNPKGTFVNTDVLKDENLGLEIEISNIKELSLKGRTSYIFPIKLLSKYAQTFSNLTIDIKGDTVKTFVTTYKPTLRWIKDWKAKKFGAFEGEVSYNDISLANVGGFSSKKGAISTMSINCVSWTEAFPVAYPCNSDDRHMPWEACEWAGQPDGPRYEIGYQTKTVCMSGGGGGEGSGNGNNQGGGGGNTIPNTPYGYEPCDQPPGRPNPDVPPCEEPTMAENLISLLGLNETEHQSQINFLMNPTKNLLVQKMNSYLWVNEGSLESQLFLLWAIQEFMVRPNISLEELEILYQVVVQHQNYVPRDREPVSYFWRTRLSDTNGSDNFENHLTETTPKYTYPNGQPTINTDAYNCHYHAFGSEFAAEVDPDHPKWVIKITLPAKKWEVVTGNIQVGDRVLYFGNQNGEVLLSHSGIVTEVDVDGYATKISSKMGTHEIIEHHPRDIPVSYGVTAPNFTINGQSHPSRLYWRRK